ncbi:MAG: glycosyltransferase [archaeon]|nr:glycosyltransferase [archaeon]
MKILICSSIYPGLAGIPTYCHNLSEEFVKAGHDVSIICEQENNQKKFEIINKKKVYRVKLTRDLKRDMNLIESKIRDIRGDFEIVIILWYKYFRPVYSALPSAKKVYVLPSIRKIDIKMINKNHNFLKKYYYILKNQFSIKLEKEAIKKCDLLVSLSKKMLEQVYSEYGIKKGVLVYPGINHKKFKLKSLKKDNTALIVANLDPRKGIDLAINVAKGINDDLKIIVVGEGNLRASLEEKIKLLNLEKKVRLVGFKNNVEDYMSRAFVYLMPSYSEGLPQVVLEAMASGLPIVAFRPDDKHFITSSKELVLKGKNGFLVQNEQEMADKINLLFKNKTLQSKMSHNSLLISKNFSREFCAKEILRLIAG